MRYELTIDAEYLDGGRWDTSAGVREFLQNARDAEIEGASLDVRHYVNAEGRGVLVIENDGAVLARETLLLGRSTKRGRPDLAGQYGEGYKLGSLALLRAGYGVKIRNGAEVWTPSIQASDKFGGRPVLVFDVDTGRADRNRVQVEIIGVTAEDWKQLREHFLFLYKREIPSVKTSAGTLLMTDKWAGRVYVKGILVQRIADLSYGYDLADAELDRDRRIVESYDLRSRITEIWSQALAARPDLFDAYYGLLADRAKDVDGVYNWSAERLPEDFAVAAAAKFRDRHGSDAVPVQNLAEGKDLEHLGARGIVVPEPLAAVLNRVIGSPASVQARLAEEVRGHHSWTDLSEAERGNLETALALVGVAEPTNLADVDVVTFRSPRLLGQFKSGRVLVARKVLANRAQTLEVVVHEFAHRSGGDGDKAHVARIEQTWSAIVESLRG